MHAHTYTDTHTHRAPPHTVSFSLIHQLSQSLLEDSRTIIPLPLYLAAFIVSLLPCVPLIRSHVRRRRTGGPAFPRSQLGLDSSLPLASSGHLECNVPAPLVPCQPPSLPGLARRLQARFVRVKALLCVCPVTRLSEAIECRFPPSPPPHPTPQKSLHSALMTPALAISPDGELRYKLIKATGRPPLAITTLFMIWVCPCVKSLSWN